MNNIYNYVENLIKKNKMVQSFLISNVNYNQVKDDLLLTISHFIFNDKKAEDNPDLYLLKSDNFNVSKNEIKELINDISTTSQFNNKKVYIIDSFEKINEYGYNAILKTLEEPQENVYAFLLTNNINLINETITSRCQKIFISSESIEQKYDENTDKIVEYIYNDILNNNINNLISNKYKLYNLIDSKDTFKNFLRELSNKLLELVNTKINENNFNNENKYFDIANKIVIINNNIVRLNYNLNKNLCIDRFLIEISR